MQYLVAPERLETERFVVRSYREDDGPLLREATNASFDHLAPWMPWAMRDQTEEEARELARRFRGRWLLAQDFVMGIFRPDGGELLGGTGFHLREGGLETRCAEVGMWIRADRAGQGLGTAVLIALLGWGFDAWPWDRIAWRCNPENAASARVAERSGMRREGLLRSSMLDVRDRRADTLVYAALRGEWKPPPPG